MSPTNEGATKQLVLQYLVPFIHRFKRQPHFYSSVIFRFEQVLADATPEGLISEKEVLKCSSYRLVPTGRALSQADEAFRLHCAVRDV